MKTAFWGAVIFLLGTLVSATDNTDPFGSVISQLEGLLAGFASSSGPYAPVTSQIVQDYLEPVEVRARFVRFDIRSNP